MYNKAMMKKYNKLYELFMQYLNIKQQISTRAMPPPNSPPISPIINPMEELQKEKNKIIAY